jgi:hypothetical protein
MPTKAQPRDTNVAIALGQGGIVKVFSVGKLFICVPGVGRTTSKVWNTKILARIFSGEVERKTV